MSLNTPKEPQIVPNVPIIFF